MYEKHFHLDQAPFSIAPDPSFLYLSGAHREAMAHLMYGFSHGGFVMVTGEVGTGKTTLLRNLLKQTPPDLDVAFILNPRLTVRELLATLCDELGIPYDVASTTTVKQYIDLITRHLLQTHRAGRSTVMIIDEAQNLSPAVLEQVRLLTNLETDERKLLRIILIGQPELAELLERQELRQLAQRITARYHLGSLDRADTYAYIMHRMSRAGGNPNTFTQGALRRLYALSKGTPRIINVIADRALLGAYTVGAGRVNARVVSQAAREVLGATSSHRKRWLSAAATIIVAGAAWAFLGPVQKPDTPVSLVTQPDETAESASDRATTPDPDPVSDSTTPVRETGIETRIPESPPATEANVRPAIEQTEDGDAVITPESYALMQAERSASSSQPPVPSLTPTSAPVTLDSTGSHGEEAIERPAGSTFSNRRLAYRAVFERWGVDYRGSDNSPIPCDFAPSAGLQCLSEQGDWGEITRLDLPVVLELWDGQAAPYHAALIGLKEDQVILQVADRMVETSRQALRDQWSGFYVVLWQTPPGYYGSIREGQNHETVGWLRQQLAALTDRSVSSSTPNQFDQGLQDAVIEFQAEEGLLTDGVVGPATWIRLAARLELPQPSLAG
jgi:general secretion pathway protein A